MKTKYEQAFDDYLKGYDYNVKQIRYKYHHSYRVEKLMKYLAHKIGLSEEKVEVASVIGLLHDIGRFEQIKKYGDCDDVKTGVDHADESCIYLFDRGHIKDFYSNEKYYPIIKDAIKNHNKLNIDSKIKDESLLFTKMIRDMDKVDIYKVITDEYKMTYDKNELSDSVLEAFNKNITIDSNLEKTNTDSIYVFLAFLYDINFKETFEIIKNGKYIENFYTIITPINNSEEDFNNLKKKMLVLVNKNTETK